MGSLPFKRTIEKNRLFQCIAEGGFFYSVKGTVILNSLTNIIFPPILDTSSGDIIRDFFNPALAASVRYDRGVGFFSASWLRLATKGIQYRLALSATPDRWFDDEGTAALRGYIGETVFWLPQAQAIGVSLTPYYYHPHLVQLTDEEVGLLEVKSSLLCNMS